jgi:hypothetical protein
MASLSDQGSPGSILRPNSRSSCAYVISPSCEASRLLSLNQLHRTSPGHEGDRSVMVDHGNETRPSPSPATLNLSSLREAKDVQSKSPHRAMHWKTIGIIIAFLLAGQYPHARGRMPLTLRSTSFRLRTLPSLQEPRRHAHRHRLPYAIPNFCRLRPFDNHLQSRADVKYRDLLRAAPVVCPPRKRDVAISS